MNDGMRRAMGANRKLWLALALITALLCGALLAERDGGAAKVAVAQAATPRAHLKSARVSIAKHAIVGLPRIKGAPVVDGRKVATAAIAKVQRTLRSASSTSFRAHAAVNPACPQLLAQRAAIVAQFAALIAQFPQLSAQLMAQEAAALALIDSALAQFSCGVPSP